MKVHLRAAQLAHRISRFSLGFELDSPRLASSNPDVDSRHSVLSLKDTDLDLDAEFWFGTETIGMHIFDQELYRALKRAADQGYLRILTQDASVRFPDWPTDSEGNPKRYVRLTSGTLYSDQNIIISNDVATHEDRALSMALMSVEWWVKPILPYLQAYSSIRETLAA